MTGTGDAISTKPSSPKTAMDVVMKTKAVISEPPSLSSARPESGERTTDERDTMPTTRPDFSVV